MAELSKGAQKFHDEYPAYEWEQRCKITKLECDVKELREQVNSNFEILNRGGNNEVSFESLINSNISRTNDRIDEILLRLQKLENSLRVI